MPRPKTSPRRRYHHGDLRRAVLAGALAEIQARGPAAVSLREIARRAGVSHAAPTHHFGDKAGVLSAIAAEGYRTLAAATGDALERTGNLVDLALAYIRFALGHRAHFEVMFRPELYRADDGDVVAARDAAADVLFRAVRRALPEAGDAELWGGVVAAWSFAHGFVTLWLNRNFHPDLGDDAEAVARLAAASAGRLFEAGAFGAAPSAPR